MTLRTLNRLTLVGAGLLYLTAMGGLVLRTMPLFDGHYGTLFWYLLLPCAVIGLVVMLVGRLPTPHDAQQN